MCIVQHYVDSKGVSHYGFEAWLKWVGDGCPPNPGKEEVTKKARQSGQFVKTTKQGNSSQDLSSWRSMGEGYYPDRKSQETMDAEELQQRRSLNKTNAERPGAAAASS
ncbi:hypothetical protein Gasu2_02950 [Galdieria sulphuraria]|uniref:Uncharacterized protein n=1 Tax=Galdieria sulphuraria TaxID=130081 RepID=M2Y0P0_GALSU|nr:uncharacterized protein Gasu_32030 [Galdieria sulphuraria]EME29374.1 hypothetical protein Gasu_32030 [Galdieria sulphuraria]GJD05846.1 hypothetical protein Gasu2_02950 [Galdieria sulphuraria]|eukprot:XP_005705894.1 hypothetical protein Gasu_32030 [Galdieria sulphuraria]